MKRQRAVRFVPAAGGERVTHARELAAGRKGGEQIGPRPRRCDETHTHAIEHRTRRRCPAPRKLGRIHAGQAPEAARNHRDRSATEDTRETVESRFDFVAGRTLR